MSNVRVRFAPSPTGPLHIGGVRTALFNYLFAKQNKGSFILRIEDTDQNRFVEGAEDYIQESLKWCGLSHDEGPDVGGAFGPYRQSERKHLYREYAEQLIEKGHAYYAFDTPEKLDFHRKDHEAKGKTFIYNWHNRLKLTNSLSLPPEEVAQKLSNNDPYVIRFKCPQDQTLTLQDIIRGTIEINSNTLDDKVIFKSDGMPTYHLANIVDDHLMEISHVIRGEEWLPSLPLHFLLYDAFGWNKPEFAHLPLIMKPTGKGKLSKRDGEKGGFPVFPLQWKESQGYREAGYYPEAVVNFLALLGWNPGTEKELFGLHELVQEFSLERVNKSGARFDPDKTVWYNRHYLQEQTNAALTEQFTPILQEKGISIEAPYVTSVIEMVKERADFVRDLWGLSAYFFVAPTDYPEKAVKKQWKENTAEIMMGVSKVLESVTDFSSQTIETQVKDWIAAEELSFGKVMPPLRLVIVGDMKGPHLFDIIAQIGRTDSLSRIQTAIERLG
ncbi:MAG: glutamate--tRNA ligase [Bacteroidota bacterium]